MSICLQRTISFTSSHSFQVGPNDYSLEKLCKWNGIKTAKNLPMIESRVIRGPQQDDHATTAATILPGDTVLEHTSYTLVQVFL